MVKVYCLQPFDDFVRWHPDVEFDVFIDGLQIATCGAQDQVAERLTAAVVDLRAAVADMAVTVCRRIQ